MSELGEVTIVRYGTRTGRRDEVYLNHHIYGEADGRIEMDYFFWIVRTSTETILVDTGFSATGGALRKRTFLLDPLEVFPALGISLNEAVTIVVTHAHYDHIGNLAAFPNARIIIASRELEFWRSPLRSRAQFAYSVEVEEIDALLQAEAEGRVRTFWDTIQVAPGVTAIEVGGHTPGQAVVLVQSADGPILIASDAVHYYEELYDDLPFAFVADLPQMYRGFDTIQTWCANGTVKHLISGHDPSTLTRFTPVLTGPLAGNAATVGSLAALPNASTVSDSHAQTSTKETLLQ